MPRGQKLTLLASLRSQAAAVIGQIESHIRRLEGELEDLQEQAAVWTKALGGQTTATSRKEGGFTTAPRPRGNERVNWDDVLASVPHRFGVEDVLKHPGAAAKGRAQAYPALNRWEATKRIKRISKGVYEKANIAVSNGARATATGGAATRPTSTSKRTRSTKAKRRAATKAS